MILLNPAFKNQALSKRTKRTSGRIFSFKVGIKNKILDRA